MRRAQKPCWWIAPGACPSSSSCKGADLAWSQCALPSSWWLSWGEDSSWPPLEAVLHVYIHKHGMCWTATELAISSWLLHILTLFELWKSNILDRPQLQLIPGQNYKKIHHHCSGSSIWNWTWHTAYRSSLPWRMTQSLHTTFVKEEKQRAHCIWMPGLNYSFKEHNFGNF